MSFPNNLEIKYQNGANRLPTAGLAFGQMLYPKDGKVAFTDEDGNIVPAGLSYVYHCTGVNDNVAISNLVNSFLNATGDFAGTTALTMKLIVDGKVGLPGTPSFGPTSGAAGNPRRYFEFNSNQTRGARVHIDWGNATLPVLTGQTSYTSYIYHAGSGSTIYHDKLSCSISGYQANAIYNYSTGTIYISNSYLNGTYGINSYSAGTIYMSNSYCLTNADNAGLINYSTGTIYISNCCFKGRWCVYNYSTGTIYISNSYCHGNSGSPIQAIANDSSGTIYILNCYCYADDSVGSGYGVLNQSTGTIYISNSYCCGRGNGIAYGVRNQSTGTIYISNSECVGISTYTSISAGIIGYGLQSNGGRVIAVGCCFRGYRRTSNTSGKGYGVYSDNAAAYIVLIGCIFDRSEITDEVQDIDVQLGTSSASSVKFYIAGCIFYGATVSIGGSAVSYVQPADGKYMPQYANFFNVTT